MAGFNNVTCGDGYTAAATVQDCWNARGGWFSVETAGVFYRQQYGVQSMSYWTEERELGAGAFATLDPKCLGVQFRNSVAGQNATVTVDIAEGDQPPINIISAGTVTVVTAGTLLRTTYLTVASVSPFTTSAATNQVRAILVGAGAGGADGGGGGQAGSGGGAGATVDTGLLAVTPSLAISFTVGAGSAHGINPPAGGNTAMTFPGGTVTAGGGQGGANSSVYQAGGAGGTPSGAIAQLLIAGQQGGSSNTFNTSTYLFAGTGGSTAYGGGGPAAIGTSPHAAGAATGYGAGGGGGIGGTGGNGSSGTSGLIIVEEYS